MYFLTNLLQFLYEVIPFINGVVNYWLPYSFCATKHGNDNDVSAHWLPPKFLFSCFADVSIGSGLGFSIAYLVYRQYYPCLSVKHCFLSYYHQHPANDLPTTATPHSFIGVKHM